MSQTYENYPIGGRSMPEHRYLFKNQFAGSAIRKRAEWQMGISLVLLFGFIGLSMWLGITAMNLRAGTFAGLIVLELILGMILIVLMHRKTRASIGTFVCELSTCTKDGQTVRHFKCLDLRGRRAETIAMGPYAPEDLELRGELHPGQDAQTPWAEFRLNVSGATSNEPETIILLGSPTVAHELDPLKVLEMAKEALVNQGIEAHEITNQIQNAH